jgi:hypothetical protein
MMDNFRIDITAEGDATFTKAMEIAFTNSPGSKVEAYKIDPEKGLVFFWTLGLHKEGVVGLPFKLDAVGAADFARRWLAEQDYGREPDHDGSNGKGWRIYCEQWGRVASMSGSFVAVQPSWAWYGK